MVENSGKCFYTAVSQSGDPLLGFRDEALLQLGGSKIFGGLDFFLLNRNLRDHSSHCPNSYIPGDPFYLLRQEAPFLRVCCEDVVPSRLASHQTPCCWCSDLFWLKPVTQTWPLCPILHLLFLLFFFGEKSPESPCCCPHWFLSLHVLPTVIIASLLRTLPLATSSIGPSIPSFL